MGNTQPAAIEGFSQYSFGAETPRWVYTRGPKGRPAVIVLHELPGMVDECIELARELSSPHCDHAGYQVHMPLLFGSPGETESLTRMIRFGWCMRNEMELFARASTSPITQWIANLVNEAAGRAGVDRVAVIGMCLTGGLVFGVLAEPKVAGVVASQPSLPIGVTKRVRRDLGLSPNDRTRNLEAGKKILALRYRDDWRCPRSRFEELASAAGEELPDATPEEVQDIELGNVRIIDLPGSLHSVLTLHRHEETVTKVKEFLNACLTA